MKTVAFFLMWIYLNAIYKYMKWPMWRSLKSFLCERVVQFILQALILWLEPTDTTFDCATSRACLVYFVLCAAFFIFWVLAWECKFIIRNIIQEEHSSNSVEDGKVDENQQSCETSQNIGSESGEASDKVRVVYHLFCLLNASNWFKGWTVCSIHWLRMNCNGSNDV